MVAQSGKCWLCKQENPELTQAKSNKQTKASVWRFLLVIPVPGGQTQAVPCSLLNGEPRDREIFSSALSFHMSPPHNPSVPRHEGPREFMSPLAVPEVIVLSTHLLLGSQFSRTSCFCQVCSFIVPSSLAPCRLPRHLRGWG